MLIKNIRNPGVDQYRWKLDDICNFYGGLLLAEYEPKTGYISSFFIKEKYRNKGYGFLMMQELIMKCNRDGFKGLTLCVFEENHPAIRLYEKSGFVKRGAPLYQIISMKLNIKKN